MSKILTAILFCIWMLITLLFVFSIIGLFMVLKSNDTGYHKYGESMRTNWMQLGFDLKENLLEK